VWAIGRDWRDRHPRFHFYDQLEPSPDIATCCARSTATRSRSRSSRDSPSRLRRPHSAGGRLCGLPIRAAPRPVSVGYDSSGISRTAPDHPGKPVGCDLAEVALADLPMTPLGTVRPTQASAKYGAFFRIISSSWRAPLRNRTVDLLLTMERDSQFNQPTRNSVSASSWKYVAGHSRLRLYMAGSWPPEWPPSLLLWTHEFTTRMARRRSLLRA
jgi:hypothetical protein